MNGSSASTTTTGTVHPCRRSGMLLRGPLLWSLGIAVYAGVALAAISWAPPILPTGAALGFYSTTTIRYVSILGSVASLWFWTLHCWTVFWSDAYHMVVQRPALQTIVRLASEWSLDEALAFVFDPNQLLASLASCVVVPVALYSLPSSPEQRARVLAEAGLLLPNNINNQATRIKTDDIATPRGNEVLVQPGGWKALLPEPWQQVLQTIQAASLVNNDEAQTINSTRRLCSCDSTQQASSPNSPMTDCSSSDDDDNSSSIHPAEGENVAKPESFLRRSKPSVAPSTAEPTMEDTNTNESLDILVSIVRQMMLQNCDWMCDCLIQNQTPAAIAAASSILALTLQLRNSSQARSVLRGTAHLAWSTVSGSLLCGSMAALVTPFILQHHPQRRRSCDRNDQQPTNDARRDLYLGLPAWMASLTRTACAIPRSVLRDNSKPFLVQVQKQWKGIAALCVLALFQYRRNRLRLHPPQQGAPT